MQASAHAWLAFGGAVKPAAKLQALYDQIPAFTCKPGCTDCCGPVPFTKTEWTKVADKREIGMHSCPYSLAGRCDIYEQRPFMCRIFGTAKDPRLACPHGCQPKTLLTALQARRLTDQYTQLIGR